MNPKKSEVDLESVRGNDLNGLVRPVLLGFAIVSIVVGLRYVLRAIYRFHMWDW